TPFEKAFLDYHNGNLDAEVIVHCTKGEDHTVPLKYFFREFEDMPHLEQKALELCFGKTLDIGAGSGCHSVVLQNRGLDVTALDISKGFVQIMEKRGLGNVVLSDIMDYSLAKFDTLLMLMNGIGLVKNFDGLEKFLQHAKTLLNPGGQIILDSTDLLYLYLGEDGSAMINLNEAYYGEVEFAVEYEKELGEPFKWVFIDFSVLSDIAEKCGFDAEMLFEDDNSNYLARLTVIR
ncbi:MAG: SAM-dependent methyltransferase, partial [Bacteroidetes bacterium]